MPSMYFMIRIERMDTKNQVVFRIDIFFFQDTKNLTYVFVFTRIEFLCFWIRISKKNVRRTRHKEWPKAVPYVTRVTRYVQQGGTVECHIKCFRLWYFPVMVFYGQITDNNQHLCHYSISDLVAAYLKQYSTPEYSAA